MGSITEAKPEVWRQCPELTNLEGTEAAIANAAFTRGVQYACADHAALVEALRKIRAVASAGPHEAECFDWIEWMQEADLALARIGSDDGVTA